MIPKLTEVMHFKVTPESKRTIRRMAKARRMRPAAWMRMIVEAACSPQAQANGSMHLDTPRLPR